MPKRKFVSTNRCFCNQGKITPLLLLWHWFHMSSRYHKLSHFEAGSLGKECYKTPCVVVVVVVAQFLSYLLANFFSLFLELYKDKQIFRWQGEGMNHPREREREREREGAAFVIQIFHDRESKSLITSFLSFCLRDSSSTDFFPLGRSIQLQTKWRTECSLVSWSFFVSWVSSSSRAHTHTHTATPTLYSFSLSSVSVGGCVRMKNMDDNIKKELWLQKERPGGEYIHPSIHPSIDGW